jgi:CBS domain-containing protein
MAAILTGQCARDLMEREFLTCEAETTVSEAVKLMDARNKGGCLIQSAIRDIVGIFTERDLLRRVVAVGRDPVQTRLGDVMTGDIVCAQANDDAGELLRLMLQENFRHLPVMDGRQAVGIISLKGLGRALIEEKLK